MNEHPVILGEHHNHGTPVRLYGVDRRRHFYCVGKTGTGKSTLARNMILQDLWAGRGVAVVDPHGQLCEDVLAHFPPWRTHHLVYLNPADLSHPVGFNPLSGVPEDRRHLAASQVVSIFKARWGDSWGPSLEQLLHNSVSALLCSPGATFLGIERLLTDDDFRARVVERVRDPVVRAFWQMRFAKWSQSQRSEKTEPVLNKVGQFLSSPLTQHILGQSQSTFDLRFMMDNQRVLLANLSKGALGEDKTSLLGALLITKTYLAAMSRADIPEEERRDFYLYADEFQNFATESFASILAESRKMRLNLTLLHQYIDQLPEPLQRAVFGNVGSLAAFLVGRPDAERLAPELDSENEIVPGHLTGLSCHQAYVKLLIDGDERQAQRIVTYPPYRSGRKSRRETLIAQSRMRFAKPREEVEARLQRWFAQGKKKEEPGLRVATKARPTARAGFHLHVHLPAAEPRPQKFGRGGNDGRL